MSEETAKYEVVAVCESPKPCKADLFRDLTKKMADTYEAKNKDYGDSFGISVRKYGKISALTRISDKFNRAENLILNREERQVNDESLIDTLGDLAAYCIMTIIEIENESKD